MDVDEVWGHIHRERRALAAVLRTLDEEEWATPSLCPGWTAKDVAAHVIGSAQMTWGPLLAATVRGGFRFDRIALLDGQRRGRAPVAEILDLYERLDGSRVHPPVVTPLEPLVDVLVHTQDLLRPLGREHAMPVDAASVAATRALRTGRFLGRPRLGHVRLVATDTDWVHGAGPEVRAPMQEVLMICAGRPADGTLLEGDGRELVRTA
ncbi:maleylpyruvate isomerase family mycothiol-dependent enzyme [Nocardioides sp. TF02-7]|uniref:maleylpyruvate isomerase family mycothiol-dependent enzyme n=1 Tax=Nocardioides sp. TF02-7 TaxID=2917724 RepID=UPI001F055C18|nr:maleylpyruvate isomerase family mycothiol-dependent enzyme [Nocardioides sp. TF02-7]UMG91335.1 maleylpyruvate isomerase family mycothiol-dependent enzyme [Nocardioides sp. TF02-7]